MKKIRKEKKMLKFLRIPKVDNLPKLAKEGRWCV